MTVEGTKPYYIIDNIAKGTGLATQCARAYSTRTEWRRQKSTREEMHKCVVLILDEMHVKEEPRIGLVCDLSYSPLGALLGFVNLGETNAHLLEFERSLEEGGRSSQPLANSMLVFMVRGLFSRFQFPYAQFSCAAVSGDLGDLMFDHFWEAVCHLERCGFKVLAATADGASPNRRFIKIHGSGGAHQLVYKLVNPYASVVSSPAVPRSHSVRRYVWSPEPDFLALTPFPSGI